jgi:5'-nucleotidase
LVRKLLGQGIWTTDDYRILYNVNFPPVMADDVQGHAVVSQGFRPNAGFSVEPQTSPSGRRYTWIKGGIQQDRTAEGTDVAANMDGYISVTPMRVDLTAYDLLDQLKEQLA